MLLRRRRGIDWYMTGKYLSSRTELQQESTYAKVHDPHTTVLNASPDLININNHAKFHQNVASNLPCQ